MKTLRQTRLKGWYEYYREVCPICGRTGGCMIHNSGDRVACIRTESKIPFSTKSAIPSWLHWLSNKAPIKNSNVSFVESAKKKSDKELNRVFRALMDNAELTKDHLEHLIGPKRQMSIQQIEDRGYCSFPSKPWNLVNRISRSTGIKDFTGIPGFYRGNKEGNKYWTINGFQSILIPFRNEINEIVGFQMRVDNPPNNVEFKNRKQGLAARVKSQPNLVQIVYDGEIIEEKEMILGKWEHVYYEGETGELLGFVRLVKGKRYFWLSSANRDEGTGPGDPVPIHLSIPSKKLKQWKTGEAYKTKSIWLSEGPLKCDITTDILEKVYSKREIEEIGDAMLALPGVGAWRLAIPMIKNIGAKRVNICFDADMINKIEVKTHLFECAKTLHQEDIELYIVIWNGKDGNGIDDLYLNHKLPTFRKL